METQASAVANIPQLLYAQYGALALGWVVAFALAGYVIILHRRNAAIYREFVDFAKDAAEKLIPVLSKNTEVLSTVVSQQNQIADDISDIQNAQGPAFGNLDLLVQTFIRGKFRKNNHPDTEPEKG